MLRDAALKYTSQTTITHRQTKLVTFADDFGDFCMSFTVLLSIVNSWREDIIEEILRSIYEEIQQRKESNLKSSSSIMSTRSRNSD